MTAEASSVANVVEGVAANNASIAKANNGMIRKCGHGLGCNV
jgi:hypothetical protein